MSCYSGAYKKTLKYLGVELFSSAPGVCDQVVQQYIGMLEDLSTDR